MTNVSMTVLPGQEPVRRHGLRSARAPRSRGESTSDRRSSTSRACPGPAEGERDRAAAHARGTSMGSSVALADFLPAPHGDYRIVRRAIGPTLTAAAALGTRGGTTAEWRQGHLG